MWFIGTYLKSFQKSEFSIIIKSFQVLISGKGRFLRYVIVSNQKHKNIEPFFPTQKSISVLEMLYSPSLISVIRYLRNRECC